MVVLNCIKAVVMSDKILLLDAHKPSTKVFAAMFQEEYLDRYVTETNLSLSESHADAAFKFLTDCCFEETWILSFKL